MPLRERQEIQEMLWRNQVVRHGPGCECEAGAERIQAADALLVTAGAGMGVDSGLPDFRGTQGFWRAYPAIARLGLSFEEMANPSWFNENPHLAWAFYGHRLNLYRKTPPHPGFRQLLEAATSKSAGYFVFTSNVDGHFQKVGFAPDRIVECHGSIQRFQCTACCTDEIGMPQMKSSTSTKAPFALWSRCPSAGTAQTLLGPTC